MIELEVRRQIDQSLEVVGWILNPTDSRRNVFFESAVRSRLSRRCSNRLGNKKPDYTLFGKGRPLAVLEAKKSNVLDLSDALKQARDMQSGWMYRLFLLAMGQALNLSTWKIRNHYF